MISTRLQGWMVRIFFASGLLWAGMAQAGRVAGNQFDIDGYHEDPSQKVVRVLFERAESQPGGQQITSFSLQKDGTELTLTFRFADFGGSISRDARFLAHAFLKARADHRADTFLLNSDDLVRSTGETHTYVSKTLEVATDWVEDELDRIERGRMFKDNYRLAFYDAGEMGEPLDWRYNLNTSDSREKEIRDLAVPPPGWDPVLSKPPFEPAKTPIKHTVTVVFEIDNSGETRWHIQRAEDGRQVLTFIQGKDWGTSWRQDRKPLTEAIFKAYSDSGLFFDLDSAQMTGTENHKLHVLNKAKDEAVRRMRKIREDEMRRRDGDFSIESIAPSRHAVNAEYLNIPIYGILVFDAARFEPPVPAMTYEEYMRRNPPIRIETTDDRTGETTELHGTAHTEALLRALLQRFRDPNVIDVEGHCVDELKNNALPGPQKPLDPPKE